MVHRPGTQARLGMTRQTPNLQLRGSTYWLSVRVPDALRDVVGKREIRRSLQTGDFKEACRLARLERVKLDAGWDALRRKARPEEKQPLRESDVLHLVARWFVERVESVDRQFDAFLACYSTSLFADITYSGIKPKRSAPSVSLSSESSAEAVCGASRIASPWWPGPS